MSAEALYSDTDYSVTIRSSDSKTRIFDKVFVVTVQAQDYTSTKALSFDGDTAILSVSDVDYAAEYVIQKQS